MVIVCRSEGSPIQTMRTSAPADHCQCQWRRQGGGGERWTAETGAQSQTQAEAAWVLFSPPGWSRTHGWKQTRQDATGRADRSRLASTRALSLSLAQRRVQPERRVDPARPTRIVASNHPLFGPVSSEKVVLSPACGTQEFETFCFIQAWISGALNDGNSIVTLCWLESMSNGKE